MLHYQYKVNSKFASPHLAVTMLLLYTEQPLPSLFVYHVLQAASACQRSLELDTIEKVPIHANRRDAAVLHANAVAMQAAMTGMIDTVAQKSSTRYLISHPEPLPIYRSNVPTVPCCSGYGIRLFRPNARYFLHWRNLLEENKYCARDSKSTRPKCLFVVLICQPSCTIGSHFCALFK